jgi:hypothetical protein
VFWQSESMLHDAAQPELVWSVVLVVDAEPPPDVVVLVFPVPVLVWVPPVPPATSALLPDAQATPTTADK